VQIFADADGHHVRQHTEMAGETKAATRQATAAVRT